MHPSQGANAPDPDDSDETHLPDGASEEKVEALAREIMEACELLGLYAEQHYQVELTHDHDVAGGCEEDYIVLHIPFRIGEVAFTTRVQAPEQDKTDDSFRTIVSADVNDAVEQLKNRFRKREGETPPSEES